MLGAEVQGQTCLSGSQTGVTSDPTLGSSGDKDCLGPSCSVICLPGAWCTFGTGREVAELTASPLGLWPSAPLPYTEKVAGLASDYDPVALFLPLLSPGPL